MDNLQATADKLASLITVALLGVFCAGAFIYSGVSESKQVEETVEVQILSIEQEILTEDQKKSRLRKNR